MDFLWRQRRGAPVSGWGACVRTHFERRVWPDLCLVAADARPVSRRTDPMNSTQALHQIVSDNPQHAQGAHRHPHAGHRSEDVPRLRAEAVGSDPRLLRLPGPARVRVRSGTWRPVCRAHRGRRLLWIPKARYAVPHRGSRETPARHSLSRFCTAQSASTTPAPSPSPVTGTP